MWGRAGGMWGDRERQSCRPELLTCGIWCCLRLDSVKIESNCRTPSCCLKAAWRCGKLHTTKHLDNWVQNHFNRHTCPIYFLKKDLWKINSWRLCLAFWFIVAFHLIDIWLQVKFWVENKFHIEIWRSLDSVAGEMPGAEWNLIYFLLVTVSEGINATKGVKGKVDNKKGPKQEVVSKNADWRYCSGVEISILSLAARVGGKFLKGKKPEWEP